jgi:hypothetical protein
VGQGALTRQIFGIQQLQRFQASLGPPVDEVDYILHRSLRRDCPVLPENRRRWNCHLYRSVGSKFVSAESLSKTGISAVSAGDFSDFLAKVAIFGSLETSLKCAKPRKIQGFRSQYARHLELSDWLAGDGRIELTHSRSNRSPAPNFQKRECLQWHPGNPTEARRRP